ncbi:hypothetical protein [Aerococcus vaginalis]
MKKNALVFVGLSALLLGACGNSSEQPSDNAEPKQEQQAAEKEEVKTADNGMKVGETENDPQFGESTLYAIQDINQTVTSGNFDINLKSAGLSLLKPNDDVKQMLGVEGDQVTSLVLEMDVTHNADSTESIYPDQGTIVTNNGSQIEADIFPSDEIGGDFFGNATKSGKVTFLFDDDPETVNNIRYIVDAPHDEEYNPSGEQIDFSFDIEQ